MSEKPVVFITGASRGLGRGVAVACAKQGYSVAINYAGNREAAEETARLCRENCGAGGADYFPVQGNVALPEDRERMIREALDKFGQVDALVNNAGIAPRVRADITETDLDSYREVMQVNLEGPYFLTQAFANYWLKEKPAKRLDGGQKILFISSISAYVASVNRGEYCISKSGLAMVTKLWATRLAGEGIGVFEIRPGIMQTDMTSGVKEKYDRLLSDGLVPQKRWGQPDDIGRAVCSILRGDFPFTTGDVFNVDGGFHLQRL